MKAPVQAIDPALPSGPGMRRPAWDCELPESEMATSGNDEIISFVATLIRARAGGGFSSRSLHPQQRPFLRLYRLYPFLFLSVLHSFACPSFPYSFLSFFSFAMSRPQRMASRPQMRFGAQTPPSASSQSLLPKQQPQNGQKLTPVFMDSSARRPLSDGASDDFVSFSAPLRVVGEAQSRRVYSMKAPMARGKPPIHSDHTYRTR